ncbi:UvrB/UvrC motif-containing protein [Devosia sp. ZB163]|uniref:UvrB/UvrC motif-containing protein n=1 Tax=Devosia sp. ZB163 TaxID=3025938 RepID=UPI002360E324|nr:UvrB/UvrC motif-containing protein [Devosia sp. ZB163]MDC9825003.1 UvrB/UvrC motif-containing protein [Devosia sp. ZB163]
MSLAAIERKIIALEGEMLAAVTREDYETAARLRDEIAALRGSGAVRKPPPGEMGLGTQVPVVEPPKGWKRPKKPDLMTNVKSRKR